ncbi:hypothetical protein [Jiangella alkaliphila]|uniref:Uncharacterized protein n=1 Tax=Jiangella alkaliphila TaxID=419479 RepID=A0A1H2LBZ2_9ACTN|nr:hypothetical protein [Jiangella alkaliphila]SDU78334.1 hypothetical protein SAMN04488563_5764 [Jiangella alkaliphila]
MLAVAVLCLAELVNVLGVTVAVPALPAIERDLDTSGELAVAGTDGHRYGWLLSAAIAVAGFAALRRGRT